MSEQPTVIHLVLRRLDTIEGKLDKLFAFRWMVAGMCVTVVVFFEVFKLIIEKP